MSIRAKIILVVLPIILATVLLVGVSSYFSATAGLNSVAREFLGFKLKDLERYAENQWTLVVENGFTQKPEFIEAVKGSIGIFAKSLTVSKTERIFALDGSGTLLQSTGELVLSPDESSALLAALKSPKEALLTMKLGGVDRVAKGFYFPALDWYFVVSETTETFFSATNQITMQTVIILAVSVLVATLLLFGLAGSLTRPIREVVAGMKEIITSGDLTKTVPVEFPDETGVLAHTFNIMTAELDKAQRQIKSFAYQAVLAQKNEQRLKNVFQRYVPQEVIDSLVARPEGALVGEERVLAVLFSDIRSFTTISESMSPSDLVGSLNQYFGYMVDIIVNRKGIIDKYIGDAIMAFFGAPVRHDQDALQSVMSAMEMSEKVKIFNEEQARKGKPPFHIGIGINYGNVTVGNIGTDKKMDYTVIGDNVNLASRLEGLTKEYHSETIISEFLWEEVKTAVPWRLLDAVKVKGKNKGVKIYGVHAQLSGKEKEGWAFHNEAMGHYFDRRFDQAYDIFSKAEGYMPGDDNLREMKDRCIEYKANPPSVDWDGAKVMKTK